jgi:hypothetical protein
LSKSKYHSAANVGGAVLNFGQLLLRAASKRGPALDQHYVSISGFKTRPDGDLTRMMTSAQALRRVNSWRRYSPELKALRTKSLILTQALTVPFIRQEKPIFLFLLELVQIF